MLLLLYGMVVVNCVEFPGVRVQWVKGYHHDNHTKIFYAMQHSHTVQLHVYERKLIEACFW